MTKFYAYFSLGMSIFFMMVSVLIATNPPDVFSNPPYLRYVVAFMVLCYGGFRLSRAINAMKNMPGKSEEEEEEEEEEAK